MACAFPEEDLNTSCHLCGSERTCNCLLCEIDLCDRCRHSHESLDKKHDIVDLPPMDPTLPSCDEHPEMTCEKFCWECSEPICKICQDKNHEGEGHVIVDLFTAAIVKRNRLVKQHAEEKHKITPYLENQLANIQKGMSDYQAYIKNLKAAMVAQAQRMKDQVTAIVEDHTARLAEMEKDSTILLEDQRQKMEGHIAEIHDTINSYREAEMTGDPERIAEFAEQNREKIARLKVIPDLVEVEPPTFTPFPVDTEFIRKQLGSLVVTQHDWDFEQPFEFPKIQLGTFSGQNNEMETPEDEESGSGEETEEKQEEAAVMQDKGNVEETKSEDSGNPEDVKDTT